MGFGLQGERGKRRFWAPKIAGERSQAPHIAVKGTSTLRRAPSAYSRAPGFFQS